MRQLLLAALLLSVLAVPGSSASLDLEAELLSRHVLLHLDTELSFADRGQAELGATAQGRMGNTDQFSLDVSSLGARYRVTPSLQLWGGKLDQNWGRSSRNALLLGPQRAPFLQAGYALEGTSWTYRKLYGDLAVDEEYKRVGIHYFDWDILPQLSVGLGEGFITSEPFAGDFVYDWTPFLPYYLAKYLPGVPSQPNSARFYLDAVYRMEAMEIYGELLVNEFPMTPGATNPALFAFTLGVEGPWWLAEYAHVRNHAYSNRHLGTTYSLQNEPIGHRFGDDFQELWLEARGHWAPIHVDFSGGVYFRGFGAGDDGERRLKKWDMDAEPFMAGTPEYHYGVHGEAVTQLQNRIEVGADLEAAYVSNFGHREGETGFYYRAGLRATVPLF